MTELTLHPKSATLIERLRASPPQSLLIYGDRGVGLFEIAKSIARRNPIVIVPEGETQILSIKTERIRQLYDETKNTAREKRFVIIDEADKMTRAAQSAFLKLLEEPNRHTYFILTSHDKEQLLQTVVSRVQSHYMPLPTKVQVAQLLATLDIEPGVRQKMAFLAPRHPSLVHRYAIDTERFEKDASVMTDARKCIASASGYERQVLALKHATVRGEAIAFVDACIQILQFTLQNASSSSPIKTIQRYLDARDQLERNANTKLVLAHLMV